jgi:hypothetical protein
MHACPKERKFKKPAGFILGFLVANILIVISMLKTYYFCVVKLMFLAANQIH